MEKFPQEYLGDGVYASYDGYQIWLAANHHENKVIAIEPQVMLALVRYAEKIKRIIIESQKTQAKAD